MRETRLALSIAEEIRSLIMREGLSAGDRLPPENELMARFQVGRSTVREAVKQLQAENIVVILHGKGSFVANHTGVVKDPLGLSFEEQDKTLRELMEVRLLMEPGIARQAAKRRTQEDLDAMRSFIDRMAKASEAGEEYESFDYGFHMAMAESVRNGVLRRMYPVVFEAIAQGYRRTAHVHGSSAVALQYHRDILDAIARGDENEASALTQKHILQALEDINRH